MSVDAIRDLFVALLVVFVMLGVGFGLELRQVLAVLRRPTLVVSALTFEHVAMPVVAWSVATAFGAPASGVLALVLCGATPGGPIGPAFVLQARGDIAFAVSLVVMMAVVNVVTTPLTLTLFGYGDRGGDGIVVPLVRMIAVYQLLPLAAAMGVRSRWPDTAARLGSWAQRATQVIITLLVVGMIAARWRLMLAIDPRTLAAIVATCAAAIALGYAVAPGGSPQRRALGITAGIRNLGLGLLVATAFDDETLLAVMLYGLAMMVVAGPVAVVMGRRAPLTTTS